MSLSGAKAAEEGQYRQVVDAIQRANLADAIQLARDFLDDGIVHATFYNLRAYWHESNGRLLEAFADLQAARVLAPDDAVILNAYGLCCARLGRMEEAGATFDAACAAQPGFAQAHFNKAWASEALGELDVAQTHYRRVTELAAAHVDAWANLAWLLTRKSSWADARRHARRALEIVPEHPLGQIALATADFGDGDVAAAETRMRSLLSDPRLQGQNRGIALGLLGDSLDHRGDSKGAFAAYCDANLAFERAFAPQIAARSSQTALENVQWLQGYFERFVPSALRAAARPGRDAPREHVFLIGFPRSGTTLLEQVLASHPDVVAMDEKEALAPSVRKFMTDERAIEALMSIDSARLNEDREEYWRYVRRLGLAPEGKVFIDKLALNSIKVPLIHRLFPEAKFLFAVRDPRDVVWGCFRQRFQMNAAMLEFVTPEKTARFYDATMRLLHTYFDKLPLRIHRNAYEDLVTDFDTNARSLCSFLQIAWNEAMRSYTERARIRAVATPSSNQVARGLYTSGMGQWRPYADQLRTALQIVQPWVDHFGYPAS